MKTQKMHKMQYLFIQLLDLVQQTVGSRCSVQACAGGLDLDQSQEQEQVVIESTMHKLPCI